MWNEETIKRNIEAAKRRFEKYLRLGNYLMAGATEVEIETLSQIITGTDLTSRPDQKNILRNSVVRFAEEMEYQLRAHDDRGGWDKCDPFWLLTRLKEETAELEAAMKNPNGRVTNVAHESADVANFAMMIADVTKKTWEKKAAEKFTDKEVQLITE
jgi:NTP pyrophosphatase (non-canonical NTP hydrolase)